MHQKPSPDPFIILLNNQQQPLHARNYFKNKVFWKRIIKKPFKKLTLCFLSNPVPFNGQSYQKEKGSGTRHQSLFESQTKFRKIPLFAIYYLTNFAMWSSFWVIPKIRSANLCICPLESGKCVKGKNHKNLNILRTKRAFQMK